MLSCNEAVEAILTQSQRGGTKFGAWLSAQILCRRSHCTTRIRPGVRCGYSATRQKFEEAEMVFEVIKSGRYHCHFHKAAWGIWKRGQVLVAACLNGEHWADGEHFRIKKEAGNGLGR